MRKDALARERILEEQSHAIQVVHVGPFLGANDASNIVIANNIVIFVHQSDGVFVAWNNVNCFDFFEDVYKSPMEC